MLTGGLHAKIAHAQMRTHPQKHSLFRHSVFFPPPLVSTLISGECQKVRRRYREQDWERFVKDKYPVWRQSCLPRTFLVFVNHCGQNLGVRGGQREVGGRWWNRWRELGVAGNGTEQQSTVSHSVSSFSLIVSLKSPTCVNVPVAFLQGSHYSKDASFDSRLLPNKTKTNKNGCFSWFFLAYYWNSSPPPDFLDPTPPWFGYQWSSWEECGLSVCFFVTVAVRCELRVVFFFVSGP